MPKKGTKTKTKTKTKKQVKKELVEEEVSEEEIVSELDVSDVASEDEVVSEDEVEINLLDVDSNGDATEVLDVSKTLDFESDLTLLKSFFRTLDESSRLTVFVEEFAPWYALREKKRKEEANEDRKKREMILQQLNKTVTLLKNQKKKSDTRKKNKSKSNREYGFNKEIDVPKVFLDFFSKHLPKEVTIKKKGKPENLIKVSKTMKRPDITALLYEYANQKNLKLETDKRIIKPDKYLRKLFGSALEENENLTFTNFQTKLKHVFNTSETKNSKTKNKNV